MDNKITPEQNIKYLRQTSMIARIEAVSFGTVLFSALAGNAANTSRMDIPLCSVLAFVFLPVYAVMIGITVGNAISLFGEIERSDTPFTDSVAKKLKKVGEAILIGSAVISVPHAVIGIITAFAYRSAIASSSSLLLGLVIISGGVLCGVTMMVAARVLALGCTLQQESDETL